MALLLSLFLDMTVIPLYTALGFYHMAFNTGFRTATPAALSEIPCSEIPVLAQG